MGLEVTPKGRDFDPEVEGEPWTPSSRNRRLVESRPQNLEKATGLGGWTRGPSRDGDGSKTRGRD